MEEIIKGNEYLLRVLPDMCAETPDAIIHKQDMDGNWQHWFTLATPAIVPQVAAVFKKEKARLSLISGYPIRNRKDDSDPLYREILSFIQEQGHVSTSLLQRRFNIGFNKAARYMDQLDRDGLVGPAPGAGKPRPVIMH